MNGAIKVRCMTLSLRKHLERYWVPLLLLLATVRFVLHPYLYNPNRDSFAYLLSGPIYQAYVLLSVGILLSPVMRRRWGRGIGWWALDVCICTFLISQVLKLAFRLPRPTGSLSGFPSGHTMLAFALAWLVSQVQPRLAPLWFALAVAIGWSRVEVNAHFTYQVLCGAALGAALGLLISDRPKGVLLPRCLPSRVPEREPAGSIRIYENA